MELWQILTLSIGGGLTLYLGSTVLTAWLFGIAARNDNDPYNGPRANARHREQQFCTGWFFYLLPVVNVGIGLIYYLSTGNLKDKALFRPWQRAWNKGYGNGNALPANDPYND